MNASAARIRPLRPARACVAALLLAACTGPAGPDAEPQVERDFVRVHVGAPVSRSWEVAGPVVVVDGQIDGESNWASLSSGTVSGIRVPYMVQGNRAVGDGASRPGVYWWYVHPNIDRQGTFRPGDCQPFPPAFPNCVWMRLTLGPTARDVDTVIEAIPDSVTVSVTEFGPSHVRASFGGRFSYTPPAGPAIHVDASGVLEVARYKSR